MDTETSGELQGFLSPSQMSVISNIDIVTSSLSVLGAGSIIFCAVCRCRAASAEILPIFQLSLADLLASCGLLTSAAMFGRQGAAGISPLCDYIAAVTSALYITTFLLTALYSAEVYQRMKQRKPGIFAWNLNADARNSKACSIITYVLIWLVPIGLSVVVVAVPNPVILPTTTVEAVPAIQTCRSCLPLFHYNEFICWNKNAYVKNWHITGKFLFLLPLTFAIVANFVFYGLAIHAFRQTHITGGVLGYHQYQEEKRVRNKAVLYQTVFFCCWLPSLILGYVSLTKGFDMASYYWLYVLQALTSPLQGFLNCIIYGWKRQGFKQALYEQTPLNGDHVPDYSNYSL